jgi:hypothetical protein
MVGRASGLVQLDQVVALTMAAKKRPKKFDVVITGEMGLYEIEPLTRDGKAWMDINLSDGNGERTRMGESVICDDSDYCREIVRGMDRDGVKVEMNGVDMKGFGKR